MLALLPLLPLAVLVLHILLMLRSAAANAATIAPTAAQQPQLLALPSTLTRIALPPLLLPLLLSLRTAAVALCHITKCKRDGKRPHGVTRSELFVILKAL